MSNAHERSHLYPQRVSDRADALIEELDEMQCRQLYAELKTIDVQEWMDWLGDARKEIAQYDALSLAQRKSRLRKPSDTSTQIATYKLHHAIVFLELWRARLQLRYLQLPPSGAPIDTHERQRELILAALASFYDYDLSDLWPFDYPEDADLSPFQG